MKNVMKKLNKKGFTLAELLIVVAIIAVLVAISIPIFNSQLEKSRDAVSVANIRAAYAEAQTAYLLGANGGNATYDETAGTVKVDHVAFKGKKSDKFSGLAAELPFNKVTGFDNEPAANDDGSVTFTYVDGEITAVAYN